MKLRLRKAKTAAPPVLTSGDDGSTSGPSMVGSTDGSFSTATPERTPGRRSSQERSSRSSHSNISSSSTSSKTHFSDSFALTFPVETRFADAAPIMPQTPTKQSQKEPVWKKRLRHKGKSPQASPAHATPHEPSRHDNELPRRGDLLDDLAEAAEQGTGLHRVESRDELEQVLEAVFTVGEVDFSASALPAVTPPRPTSAVPLVASPKPSPDTPEAKPGPKPFTKSVSFDEAGLMAVKKAKKRSSRSRRQHQQNKHMESFEEEESFDELMRSHSEYSDIFTDIFEDEDFSLATPIIYTDDEEEEDGEEVEDTAEDESTVDSYERRSRRKEKRRSERRRRIKYEEDEEEEDVTIGCQSIQVLEEFKVLTELFVQEQQCICVKPEEESPSPRRRRGRGRSRRSTRRPAEH